MVIAGLDIGGANLKVAVAHGPALTRRFPLYRAPERLAAELAALLAEFPEATELAVTMTGELCDCYPTKRVGVLAILEAVEMAAAGRPVRVYRTDGRFAPLSDARAEPLLAAASNWLALATVAAQLVGPGRGVLLDIGSTTSDLIPLLDGHPCPLGRTDPERLRSSELVYQGVRRTPVCAVLGVGGAAEFFATFHDVYLLLGQSEPDPTDTDTADGRPATVDAAHARLARMILADVETSTEAERLALARWLADLQTAHLTIALEAVLSRMPGPPQTIVLAGSGRFLGRELVQGLSAGILDLAERWTPAQTDAACAHAVALLAEGTSP